MKKVCAIIRGICIPRRASKVKNVRATVKIAAVVEKNKRKRGVVGAPFFIVVFLRNYFDKTVHRGEDVAKRYDISILGSVSQ